MSAELTPLDRVVDVIEEGFGLALRTDHLVDTSLVARTIGSTPYVLCASPALISQRRAPVHQKQLEEWPTICFAPSGEVWQLRVDGKL